MERVKIHKCEEMDEHNRRIITEEGTDQGLYQVLYSNGWRLWIGVDDYAFLIDYCPFCGVCLK